MILLNSDKAPDLLLTIASRAHILSLHDRSSLRLDRDSMRTCDPDSGIFGFQADDGRVIGVASYVQAVQHGFVRFYTHFETDDRQEIKDALLLLQKLASSSGALKISFIICRENDGIADMAREMGFSPEVKMRQHVYSGGQYLTATEYGCIL